MDTAGELKHVWVRKQIQDLVATTLRPGDALLGERQLEEQFGVSRITVRRAISDLVQEGALVRIKGKGTFVSHGRVRSTLHLASFNEDMRAAGFEPGTRVITARTAVPPGPAAEHLQLAPGREAYQISRLRLANGTPVSVDESWLPPRLLPGLLSEDLTGSLYRVLAAFGHPVQHVEQTVEAAAAPEVTAALLDIAPGAPVLLFHRRSFTGPDDPGIPIEYSISTYRSDRYQVSMRLGLG
ncbi:GntR family transcriptional regulator [Arthrobacter sp. V4I6]|uniref:GntR family transcriptional regulator n=1 Tax=unclassified Arthrobacter TaxID=235627 RepID=UPI0027818063|nr:MULTISPECIES: GntR family transcriptional regulator [unclassified Arthrobacter]MDQ0819572.1 GntR family transcriptional regulator [Arthrobacter sp. V1I7]MDQ0853752.1 GntR family transcriptional regulator [Arthrobacter sp. V4I6]